jgi:aryl-alcohol dehydrogenase-like predicted oxidoreductase
VLTGKYQPGATAGRRDARRDARDTRMMQTEFREESLRIAQQLKAHCERKGVGLSHFAVAWVLANRAVSSVIAGPAHAGAMAGLFGALDCVVDAEDEVLVDALVKPGHPSTPGYNDPAYPLAAALSGRRTCRREVPSGRRRVRRLGPPNLQYRRKP